MVTTTSKSQTTSTVVSTSISQMTSTVSSTSTGTTETEATSTDSLVNNGKQTTTLDENTSQTTDGDITTSRSSRIPIPTKSTTTRIPLPTKSTTTTSTTTTTTLRTTTPVITTSEQIDDTTTTGGSTVPVGLIGGVVGGLVVIVLLVVAVVVIVVCVRRKRKQKPSTPAVVPDRKISTVMAPGVTTIRITDHMNRPALDTAMMHAPQDQNQPDTPEDDPPYQNHEIVQIVQDERKRKISQSESLHSEQLKFDGDPVLTDTIIIDPPQEEETCLNNTGTGLTKNKEHEVSYANLKKLDTTDSNDAFNNSNTEASDTKPTFLKPGAMPGSLPHKPSYAVLPDISKFNKQIKQNQKEGIINIQRHLSQEADPSKANIQSISNEDSNNSQTSVAGYVNVDSSGNPPADDYSQVSSNIPRVPMFELNGADELDQQANSNNYVHAPPIAHKAPDNGHRNASSRAEHNLNGLAPPVACKNDSGSDAHGYVNVKHKVPNKGHRYINMPEYDVPDSVPVHAKSLPDLKDAYGNNSYQLLETAANAKPAVAAKPEIPKKQRQLQKPHSSSISNSDTDRYVDDVNPYAKPRDLQPKPIYDKLPGSKPIIPAKGSKHSSSRAEIPGAPAYGQRVSENEKRYS